MVTKITKRTGSAVHHAAPREHKPVEPQSHAATKKSRYVEAIGRRKTAIARVRIASGAGKILVNGKDPKAYFALPRLSASATAPLRELQAEGSYDVSAKVSGGGMSAQADAIRLAIARAIIHENPEWKKRLRASGFLTRDPRMVERKKYGLKKSRRRPQWAKR